MKWRAFLKQFIFSDWIVGLFLFLIFLATNGYTFGWDDQHLEIPLLKSLIDPTLYAGDYYVESLKSNFVSFLYPILARLITVEQIPLVYFVLYLLSRYLFFTGIYKLWRLLSGGSRFSGFCCVLMLITVGRVEEFLYRTFSHEEFSFIFIAFGFVCFFQNKYWRSALLWGIAANFHALYSLFPMMYQAVYLLFTRPKENAKSFGKSFLVFALTASPVLVWIIQKRFIGGGGEKISPAEWLPLYMLACPQNFLFQVTALNDMMTHLSVFFQATYDFWGLLAFYFLNRIHNAAFRDNAKVQMIMATGAGFLIISFLFTYIWPSRFVLDLNLIRHVQFMYFFLYGYTVILLVNLAGKEKAWFLLLLALLFPFIRFGGYVRVLTIAIMFFLLTARQLCVKSSFRYAAGKWQLLGCFILISLAGAGMGVDFAAKKFSSSTWTTVLVTEGILFFCFLSMHARILTPWRVFLRRLFILIPLMAVTVNFMFYHHARLRIEQYGPGFWQLQRNWEDMQRYVRDHTSQQSFLMVPYNMEMGGFRIFSERRLIVCYRDCGIVGFDYQAAREWQRRVRDIEPFKVYASQPLESALSNAILKYKVNYIVFMNYIHLPPNPLLKFIYRNEVFSLYQVLANPI